jgi:hypothetical protein
MQASLASAATADAHGTQISCDALDTETDELARGRIESTRDAVRAWVERFPGRPVDVAVKACTGWLSVRRSVAEARASAHPAEVAERAGQEAAREDRSRLHTPPARTALPRASARGAAADTKRDRVANTHPAAQDTRRGADEWLRRIRSTLFHYGVPADEVPERLLSRNGRFLADPNHLRAGKGRRPMPPRSLSVSGARGGRGSWWA